MTAEGEALGDLIRSMYPVRFSSPLGPVIAADPLMFCRSQFKFLQTVGRLSP